ncbi:hypothetical protein [Hansschlegelia zhihuaiae]|uniref:Uncharacterized protein n=1 Tax=Hansschlegelia zhihuaiae TaxID=405005 RepID=A0A4Q0MIC0_9HYPH|nr:hypothetical protein [Hansschlegelia zhihuaiae]RXF73320.1 hypothetical protein EK403_10865 [Hansschlegelia zhihuaiae]
MADYFPVLSRAVAQLETNTGEARRAVYERARAAIVRQLRAIDPPLSEEDISRERMQLEEAIRRVEASAGGGQPAPSKPAAAAPAPAAQPARPAAAERPTPPAPEASAPEPRDDARQERREARQEGGKKARRAEQQAAASRGERAEPAQARPAKRADGRPIIQAAGAPGAGREQKRSGPLIALGVLGAVAIVAGLFLLFRSPTPGPVADGEPAGPTETAKAEPETKPADAPKPDAPADGKSDDRLPQDSAAADRPPSAEPTPSAPAPQAEPPATPPPAEQEVARAPEPAAPPPPAAQPSPAPAPNAPAQPGPLVAQRAVLYEEGPNQQSGEALQGQVLWRTESVSGGQNQPLETALRGEIDIPGRKLRSTITIRRNLDATLPASHTIEIQFTLPDDFPNAGISNVPGVLMKADESARGSAVAGLSVRVTNGFFLIGLSNLDTERTVNEQLLRDRGWIDIPILYDNGRRAVLTLEKGTPGAQAFQDAFAAWRSASAAGSPQ